MIWLVRPRDRLFRIVSSSRRARLILVAMEADRGLADALDDLEDRLALLLADRVAEDASQKPDVVAKGKILLGRDVGIDQRTSEALASAHYAALRINPLSPTRQA